MIFGGRSCESANLDRDSVRQRAESVFIGVVVPQVYGECASIAKMLVDPAGRGAFIPECARNNLESHLAGIQAEQIRPQRYRASYQGFYTGQIPDGGASVVNTGGQALILDEYAFDVS